MRVSMLYYIRKQGSAQRVAHLLWV